MHQPVLRRQAERFLETKIRAFGLARQLSISRGEAQDYIALYFSRYPGVRDFMERTRQQAREQGYVESWSIATELNVS